MTLFLSDEFKKLWKNKDPFAEVQKLDGKIFRSVKNRRTLRFKTAKRSYFLKLHNPIGLKELFKNLFQFKVPAVGAKNEWLAIKLLEKLNIDTMTVAAYGLKGINPAKQCSFIITEDLGDLQSLEDFCMDWPRNPPSFQIKQDLLKMVAHVSRTIHANGINHRDYYICHFLLADSENNKIVDPNNLKAHLIDLHRAQIRKKVPRRWLVKDVSGIYFSAMDIGLTRNDVLRFIKLYSVKSLRKTLEQDKSFWLAVDKKAKWLYRKDFKKEPITVI